MCAVLCCCEHYAAAAAVASCIINHDVAPALPIQPNNWCRIGMAATMRSSICSLCSSVYIYLFTYTNVYICAHLRVCVFKGLCAHLCVPAWCVRLRLYKVIFLIEPRQQTNSVVECGTRVENALVVSV